MKEYVFDLSEVRSLDDWWDIYLKIVNGPGWEQFGRNRDAYSDSLDGGPGFPNRPCRFVFINVGLVGADELRRWTKQELLKKIESCHSSWVPLIEKQLELLEYGIGETLHHWIMDPVLGHEGIDVLVKELA